MTGTYYQCQEQRQLGESCVNDEDCVNYAGCAYDWSGVGTCTRYFTVENGADVAWCPGHINKLCKSSVCVLNGRTNYTCIDGPATQASLPSQCIAGASQSACNSKPLYGYGESYFIPLCECGYTLNGTAYCNLNPGDDYYQRFIEYERRWYNSTYVTKCNTQRRESLPCIETYWDQYDQYLYYYAAATAYPQLQDNQDCVKHIYNQAFYSQISEDQDDDWGAVGALTGLLAMIAL
jgi:hypothetical protein